MKRLLLLLAFLSSSVYALDFGDGGGGGTAPTSPATVTNLTVNGNTTIGSNNSDTMTINVSSIAVSATNSINISTGTNGLGTSILFLDTPNKRVGVNDTSPDAALDVGGAIAFDGNGTFGNAITDIVTFNALFTIASNSAPRTNVTPTAIGQQIINTGSDPDQVCISTGTTISTWATIADFNTACSN